MAAAVAPRAVPVAAPLVVEPRAAELLAAELLVAEPRAVDQWVAELLEVAPRVVEPLAAMPAVSLVLPAAPVKVDKAARKVAAPAAAAVR